MLNNRMLAVTAVLALAIPTLGAAAPIAVPPVPEQLVEGHTVFTVIETYDDNNQNGAEFAAAVAVLVREYDAAQRNVRFPGVLWFNDQYLVNPSSGGVDDARFRYPCGGAVMAVNAGDDDPRVILAYAGDGSETRDAVYRYDPVTGPGVDYGDDTNPTTGGAGPDDPADARDEPSYAWANVTQGTPPSVNSDGVATSLTADPAKFTGGQSTAEVFDYNESYLITDPNDHVWVIDKYDYYSRVGTSTLLAGVTTQVYQRPVWVVNLLGAPAFIPDDGIASCGPYNDLVTYLYDRYVDNPAGNEATSTADSSARTPYNAATGSAPLPYQDNPHMGYQEPSTNGYCYNGNPMHVDSNGDGIADSCDATRPTQPVRLYNALLYFRLGDLDQAGTPRTHDAASTDTNGCQVGTEWECPNGDDNAEGNSHPFHPTPGDGRNPSYWGNTDAAALEPLAHRDQMDCPAASQDPLGGETSNHGGSTTTTGYCDNVHATRNVDIYFSPAMRPFAPLVRYFAITDTAGSTAPFHQGHHEAAAP